MSPAPDQRDSGDFSPPEPPSRGTILVVDDDLNISLLYQLLLRDHGYTVLAAGNGEEALLLFLEPGPRIDLVISDIGMPGLKAVEMFRVMKATSDSEMLVCSGMREHQVELALQRVGVTEFVQKPFNPQLMLERVQALLSSPRRPSPDYEAAA